MSQNIIVLPTSGTVSGLQMTQDTNNALDTLNTLWSGTSAPGSPEPGQFWHDITNNILKLRSLDNTTWITLFSLNESAYIASLSNVNLGTSTATTAAAGTSSTEIATTAFVSQTLIGGAMTGLLPTSISGNSTSAAIAVSIGQCTDATMSAVLRGTGYSWAASNGNAINGTDAASSTLANSATYHMFLCAGGSGTGTFASTSLTPTLPAGYNTYKRRIFSFNTSSAGAPVPFTAIEAEGGSMLAWLTTQLADVNVSNLGTSRTTYTLTIPSGIKVEPKLRFYSNSGNTIIFTSGDETDVAPAATLSSPLFDSNSATAIASTYITTNTSGQIGARAGTASTELIIITRGFKDFRRV